jgi:hypothetical protein
LSCCRPVVINFATDWRAGFVFNKIGNSRFGDTPLVTFSPLLREVFDDMVYCFDFSTIIVVIFILFDPSIFKPLTVQGTTCSELFTKSIPWPHLHNAKHTQPFEVYRTFRRFHRLSVSFLGVTRLL